MTAPTIKTVTIDHTEAGRIIRALRTKAGVSVRGLAKRLGCTASFISDLERGRRNWTEERFAKAVKSLGK